MDKRNVAQALGAFLCNPHIENFLTGRISRVATKQVCVPGLNCYSCPGAAGACPVGSFQSFLSGVFPRFPAYVLGFVLLMGLAFGRVICGWACPFGFLQELVGRFPVPKLPKSRRTRALARMKPLWGILFVVLLPLAFWAVTGTGVPAFCKYLCPAGTLEGAVPLLLVHDRLRAAAGSLTAWKFAVLAFFLGLMAFAWRPFCRWLCPLGAFYGRLNRVALLGIAVDSERCVRCGACARVCRLDVSVAGDPECISCGDCLTACPTRAISFRRLPMLAQSEKRKGESV